MLSLNENSRGSYTCVVVIWVETNKRGKRFTGFYESPVETGASSDFAFAIFTPKMTPKNAAAIGSTFLFKHLLNL